jgi:hypothetical protein
MFQRLNIKIKYNHSAEYKNYTSYDEEYENINKKEKHIRCDDMETLKNTVLDPESTYANKPVLYMMLAFKDMFIKEHTFNGYTYFDKIANKMMYDSFDLLDDTKDDNKYDSKDDNNKDDTKKVTFKYIFDEKVLKETKSIVCVIYKKEDDSIFIADHRHDEDETFGFPSVFHSVPGGRRDSENPLSTFFQEIHEELILGDAGIPFFDDATITGYQLNEVGALFIFCEVMSAAKVSNYTDTVEHTGFKPFSLTVYRNHQEFLTIPKDDIKEYKNKNAFKVLIPRQQGKFDSVGSWFRQVSFNETLFGIPGRFDCYKKGSIVYNGLLSLQ